MSNPEILIIDDDTLFLFLTEKILESVPGLGKVHSISEVGQAQEFLKTCKEQEASFPDVIFVDLNMPEMSGMEFADYYNQQYASLYPDTKLVMLTSSISRKEKAKALEIPAIRDFYQKPLTEEKLSRLLV